MPVTDSWQTIKLKLPTDQAHWLASFVILLQEFLAVLFQLVCLTRLNSDITSNLVLFLTLVVFTGPYLNTWLLFADKMCFHMDAFEIFWAIITFGFQLLGAFVAASIVKSLNSNKWGDVIPFATPQEKKPDVYENEGILICEEAFAVLTLLIACIYLLSLKYVRKEKDQQKNSTFTIIEITFYWQLTLVVAAACQAFPSAGMSPHILLFKLQMEVISVKEFGYRMLGGFIGLILTFLWFWLRVNYEVVQEELPDGHEHKTRAKARNSNPKAIAGSAASLPLLRLSMNGNSYY